MRQHLSWLAHRRARGRSRIGRRAREVCARRRRRRQSSAMSPSASSHDQSFNTPRHLQSCLCAPPCPPLPSSSRTLRPQHVHSLLDARDSTNLLGGRLQRQHNPSIFADLHNHTSDTRHSFDRTLRTTEMARSVVTACVSTTPACPHSPFLRLVRLDGWTSSLAIQRAPQAAAQRASGPSSRIQGKGDLSAAKLTPTVGQSTICVRGYPHFSLGTSYSDYIPSS